MPEANKSQKRADALFGQIALRLGIVTREQLQEALELQRYAVAHKPLGMILIELQYVKDADLARIVEVQKKALEAANSRREVVREDNLFGKVAISMGHCTEEQVH